MNSTTSFERGDLIFEQARTLAVDQNMDEAKRLLSEVLEINPAHLPAYSLLEWILDFEGRTDEAVLIRSHAQWVTLALRLLEDA